MMTVKRVAVAVRAMDPFTGTSAEHGTVRIYMADGAQGICKEDGYVVFWDNGEEKRNLILESPFYEKEKITVQMEELRRKKLPVLSVWMKPGKAYPYSGEIRLEQRRGEPKSLVKIPMEQTGRLVTLSGAYPVDQLEPELIQMKVPEDMEVEGRMLYMKRLSDGVGEYFTIWEARNRSAGLYELTEPLHEVYGVFDGIICLVWQAKADEHGYYQVPKFS